MKIFATGGADGRIFIYNLFNYKFIRGFYIPSREKIDKLVVYQNPLHGLVIFSKNNIYSYSING
jgi:hypothetical protein